MKLGTQLGSQAGGQPKIWGGMTHSGHPLESPLRFEASFYFWLSGARFEIVKIPAGTSSIKCYKQMYTEKTFGGTELEDGVK